eukprot:Clim_evm39s152 gene=Clim_evmTU39s152
MSGVVPIPPKLRDSARMPQIGSRRDSFSRFTKQDNTDDDRLDEFKIVAFIGAGNFGKVYKARYRGSGGLVAIKTIEKEGKGEKDISALRREIEIMEVLRHPNILPLRDHFETQNMICVVTEYKVGELSDILEDDKTLDLPIIQKMARQLVSALHYLHQNRIIHRDLKPQNILVGDHGSVCICDFGFARFMTVESMVMTSIKGTPLYMAPEIVKEAPYDHTADIWSLGCIIYEAAVGQPPFQTKNLFHLVGMIMKNPIRYPKDMDTGLRDFLKAILKKDRAKRMEWPALLHHPFVMEAHEPHGVNSHKEAPVVEVKCDGGRRISLATIAPITTVDIRIPTEQVDSDGGSVEDLLEKPLTPTVEVEEQPLRLTPMSLQGSGSGRPLDEQLQRRGSRLVYMAGSDIPREDDLKTVDFDDQFMKNRHNLEGLHVPTSNSRLDWTVFERSMSLGLQAGVYDPKALIDPTVWNNRFKEVIAAASNETASNWYSNVCVASLALQIQMKFIGLNNVDDIADIEDGMIATLEFQAHVTDLLKIFNYEEEDNIRNLMMLSELFFMCSSCLNSYIMAICRLQKKGDGTFSAREPFRHILSSLVRIGMDVLRPSYPLDPVIVHAFLGNMSEVLKFCENDKTLWSRFYKSVQAPGFCERLVLFSEKSIDVTGRTFESIMAHLTRVFYSILLPMNMDFMDDTARDGYMATYKRIVTAMDNHPENCLANFAFRSLELHSFPTGTMVLGTILSGPIDAPMARKYFLRKNLVEPLLFQTFKFDDPMASMMLVLIASVLTPNLKPWDQNYSVPQDITDMEATTQTHLLLGPIIQRRNSWSYRKCAYGALAAVFAFEAHDNWTDVAGLIMQSDDLSHAIRAEIDDIASGVAVSDMDDPRERAADAIFSTGADPVVFFIYYGLLRGGDVQGERVSADSELLHCVIDLVHKAPEEGLISDSGHAAALGALAILLSQVNRKFHQCQEWEELCTFITEEIEASCLDALLDDPDRSDEAAFKLEQMITILNSGYIGRETPAERGGSLKSPLKPSLLPTIMALMRKSTRVSTMEIGISFLANTSIADPEMQKEFVKLLRTDREARDDITIYLIPTAPAAVIIDLLSCFSSIARKETDGQDLLMMMDIVGLLRPFLDSNDPIILAKVCNLIGNLCKRNDMFYSKLKEMECIGPLGNLLNHVDDGVRQAASLALGNAAYHSAELHPLVLPFVQQLVHLVLHDTHSKVVANAAGALGNLVRFDSSMVGQLIDMEAVDALLECITSPGSTGTCRQVALFAIGNICTYEEGRKYCATKGLPKEFLRDHHNLFSEKDLTYYSRIVGKYENSPDRNPGAGV